MVSRYRARACGPRLRRVAGVTSLREAASLRPQTTGALCASRVAQITVDGRGIRNKASNPIDQELANCGKADGIRPKKAKDALKGRLSRKTEPQMKFRFQKF
jgi:hypothetical protein